MTTSLGRYRIVDLVGAGGMGLVYRAEDVELRRPVALKVLAPSLASDDEYRARFLREARVAASLNHPNTCVVYEVGEMGETVGQGPAADGITPGTPFIAMELIEGETLATRLTRSGPLPVDTTVDIAVQVAEGLAEAHSRQIVHRDLKPQNVMVMPSERVKIVDFGLAKPARPVADARAVVSTSEMISAEMGDRAVFGTCSYMSPEQAAGKALDARSDVFSFGIMLYQMIAGRLPFVGDTTTETLAKILEADPAPLATKNHNASGALEQVMWQCLRKRPSDRYSDARALLKDLRGIAASQPRAPQTSLTGWATVLRVVLPTVLLLTFLAAYVMVRDPDVVRQEAAAGTDEATTTPVLVEAPDVPPVPETAAPPPRIASDTIARPRADPA